MGHLNSKIDLDATICAVATPPGQGGLGIVRVSGPEAIAIADRIFRGHGCLNTHAGFTVHHGFIHDIAADEPIDEVLVSLFRAPRSYSGEDMVEISTHGGTVVLRRVLWALTESGAKIAAPGEFTMRAFLNGRIDLTEAEAVSDLISAKTEASAQAAVAQLRGALHEKIARLRRSLTEVLARLEMGIDFTEEDLPAEETATLGTRLTSLQRDVENLLEGYTRGRILRDGFQVVLAGPPNVGKSTLFNRIAQDDRAIVTDIPGTTRDILREYINLEGWPVCLVDTAGLRESVDVVESIGIGRTTEAMVKADGIIWITDATREIESQIPPRSLSESQIPYLITINKVDIAGEALKTPSASTMLPISAKTGSGVDDLLRQVRSWILRGDTSRQEAIVSINDRHRDKLTTARESISKARDTLADGADLEFVAFETRAASVALGEIIGETTPEDVLGEIFSNFCVGK